MNKQNQMICAWAGPVCIALFFIGFWPVSGFFPPHLPSAGAVEIAAIYQRDTNMIRLGMLIMMVGAAFTAPFVAVISMQMKRIEGRFPVFSYTQLGTGMLGVVVLIIPIMIFAATTFRPEHNPELTQLLNDLGWVLFVMPFAWNGLLGFWIPATVFSTWYLVMFWALLKAIKAQPESE